MRHSGLALSALFLTLASNLVLAQDVHNQIGSRNAHSNEARDDPAEAFKIWNRERNAHACLMSIVFIVLYPLGAISIHLPIDRIPFLKNTYLRKKVTAMHVPIQLIAFSMMTGGMALGIKVAQYVGFLRDPVHAHVVIGFIVVCTIILFQPFLGIMQHRHFKKTGGKSKFAYLHRWIGRGSVLLGMINTGLGFQLAQNNIITPRRSYVRSYLLLAILVSVWFGFVVYDELRLRKAAVVNEGGEKGTRTKPEGLKVDT
ncbi:hypothetical protein V8C37DRAFT_377276 [Trichoderma ceciliae]